MIEDKLLLRRFKRGSADALARIYDKYARYLLRIAAGLLIDLSDAEDAVHDMFVKFAQSAGTINVNGSLKGYLATCVMNRSRDMIRKMRRRGDVSLDDVVEPTGDVADRPDLSAIRGEDARRLHRLLGRIPYEQREVVILRLNGQMTFRRIAEAQGESINTVQGRYRYGLDKLRSLLASEVCDESPTR